MSKYLIGITISATIATIYTYLVGNNSKQINNIPSFYIIAFCIHLIQIIAYIPAIIYNTQIFYDLTGSISYICAIIFCLIRQDHLYTKQIIGGAMVLIWTFRLGGFLFYRILLNKQDSRFKKIKQDKIRFFMTWFIQGLWVTITAGPIFIFLTQKLQNKQQHYKIGTIEIIGIFIWVIGFLIQSTADFQKLLFNSNPKNKDKFIKQGLWKYSRHPNYCGEIIIWLGVSIFVSQSLYGWQKLSLISPIFVYLLLTKISGVPMLQAKADKKWGGNPQYQQYKNKTPVMFPWMLTSSSKNYNSIEKTS